MPVRAVIEQHAAFQDAELVEGLFEHETDMPGRSSPSQTDLLALLHIHAGYAILGVEGKVDEAFGPRVLK